MVAALQMQSTRQHILEYLQRQGRATVKELGSLLGLTSTGIRQHLTVLERDGLVDAREERGRVGRPTLAYSLTEKADALFPKTYDALAAVLLEEIRCSQGNERLHDLLHKVAERMAAPYVHPPPGPLAAPPPRRRSPPDAEPPPRRAGLLLPDPRRRRQSVAGHTSPTPQSMEHLSMLHLSLSTLL